MTFLEPFQVRVGEVLSFVVLEIGQEVFGLPGLVTGVHTVYVACCYQKVLILCAVPGLLEYRDFSIDLGVLVLHLSKNACILIPIKLVIIHHLLRHSDAFFKQTI
jgi:hypothetical protein